MVHRKLLILIGADHLRTTDDEKTFYIKGHALETYKDANGKDYPIEITGYEIRELKKAGIDLGSPAELGHYLIDSDKLADVLLVITAEQREKDGIDERKFLRAFSGDAIDSARSAFTDAYIDYLPKKERAAIRKGIEIAMAELDNLEATIETEMQKNPASSGANT